MPVVEDIKRSKRDLKKRAEEAASVEQEEVEEDIGSIEKPKRKATQAQIDNLAKGREKRKQNMLAKVNNTAPAPEPVAAPPKTPKAPKVVYESESEAEPDIIIVKKKKKKAAPPTRQIVYESESEEEAPLPVRKPKKVTTQQIPESTATSIKSFEYKQSGGNFLKFV